MGNGKSEKCKLAPPVQPALATSKVARCTGDNLIVFITQGWSHRSQ